MNRDDFRRAVPPMPEHFIHAMDETLERIERTENMNGKHKKKQARTLLLIAAMLALLVGTAAAVGTRYGIFDFMNRVADPIVPLESAKEVIQSDVAIGSGEYGSVVIEEAAYSGNNYVIVAHIISEDGVESGFPSLEFENVEFKEYGFGDQYFEDGSVSYEIQGYIQGEAPQTLEGKLEVALGKNGKALEWLSVPLKLTHSEGVRVKLTPQNEGERWSVVSAELFLGELSGTLDIQYRYESIQGEEMGVDIRLLDMNGEELPAGGGSYETIEQEDGSVIYRQIGEIQSMKELPEKLYLRPKVIGEAAYLETIECLLETE